MSHLFFIDESGQDRKQMPYEIHGGIAVPLEKAWDLIRQINTAQRNQFGLLWKSLDVELKGDKLLRKKVFRLAKRPGEELEAQYRKECAGEFMRKGYEEKQSRLESNPKKYEKRKMNIGRMV